MFPSNPNEIQNSWDRFKNENNYFIGAIYQMRVFFKKVFVGFPGGAVVEKLPANAGDMGSSPGLGRSHMPRSN